VPVARRKNLFVVDGSVFRQPRKNPTHTMMALVARTRPISAQLKKKEI
jgi:hypothetical protein